MAKPTLLVAGKLRAPDVEPSETPIAYIQQWIRKRLPEFGGHSGALADRVLIIRAETGSGKSTVLPVGVFRVFHAEEERTLYRGPGVICTQPRVLTAVALARDVSAERVIGGVRRKINKDMTLDVSVGFQTGPISSRRPTGLTYATAGVLAAQLRQQGDAELMGRYRVIIVDEAHERSLDADLTLMLLRGLYRRNAGNARLPFLLVASATFDPPRYAEYFGVGPANVLEVEGRAYGIETHWPAHGTNDYPAEAAAVAARIHEAHPDDPPERADILIFVPGAAEAAETAQALAKANRRYTRPPAAGAGGAPRPAPLLVLNINREAVAAQTEDYGLVFEAPARLPRVEGRAPGRRVIVSTVVAETGLTVDTLRYVVDCGWSRAEEAYQPWGARGLVTRPAPRNRVEQRRGRAGRMFPGEFYPLYTEEVYAALDRQQLPDVVTEGVGEVLLAVAREQQRQKLLAGAVPEFRAEDIGLLDPPPPEAYLAAQAVAVALGFLAARAPLPVRWPPAFLAEEPLDAPEAAGARGWGLTRLGHLAALFTRTPVEGVRVLFAGYVWGAAASDLATVAAMHGITLDKLLTGKERRRKGGDLPPGAEALRAALPPYLAQRVAGGSGATGPLPPTESEAFYFRARLLLADEFAEAALIFDAFARRADAARGDTRAVAEWCAVAGLSFDSLLEVARRREHVLEEMVVAGLDPYRADARRLYALPAEAFTDGLARFKRCLYDGYRARLLRYAPDHPDGPGYTTAQGLRVRVPELLTDAAAARLRALGVAKPGAGRKAARPRWVLTDQVRLVSAPPQGDDKKPPLLYAAAANLVSVLDGYVDVDPEFDAPRAFGEAAVPGAGW
jgi:hypothetical protein